MVRRSTHILFIAYVSTGLTSVQAIETRWSGWGPVANGLQCRISAPESLEVRQGLEVIIELRMDVPSVPSWMLSFNPINDSDISLMLVNTGDGNVYEIGHEQQKYGPPMLDTGKYTVPLDGSPIPKQTRWFRLVDVDDTTPGDYWAFVRYAQSYRASSLWSGGPQDWDMQHFWYGSVVSESLPLSIQPETPKTRTILVPKRLRLAWVSMSMMTVRVPYAYHDRFLITTFSQDDAESIEVPTRNGHWIATSITQEKGRGLRGGVPQPMDINGLAQWHRYYGGDIAASYHIIVFETCDNDDPKMIGPGSAGYKVLWEKTLEIKATADEIQKAEVIEPQPLYGPH